MDGVPRRGDNRIGFGTASTPCRRDHDPLAEGGISMTRATKFLAVAAVLATILVGCSSKKPSRESAGTTPPASTQAPDAVEPQRDDAAAPAAPTVTATVAGGKIRTGMTYDEVVAQLGEPTTKMALGEMLQCAWEKDSSAVVVHFQDDKAMAVHYGGESSEAPAADAGKVAANFSKVKIGMSEDEVDKLLGPATKSGGAGDGDTAFAVKQWVAGDDVYVVTFMNGKVQVTHKEAGE